MEPCFAFINYAEPYLKFNDLIASYADAPYVSIILSYFFLLTCLHYFIDLDISIFVNI